jgi:palmitoyl transferase
MRSSATRALLAAAFLCLSAPASADCDDLWDWLNSGCRRVVDTYEQGSTDLILSGYAWHLPWTWTDEKRAEENQNAWGGGWARTVEQVNGDTDSVFVVVFNDSHSRPQYNLGYGWSTYWGQRNGVQGGLGYTLMLVARNDIANGWPFPAVLPLLSVRYDKFTVYGTYVPSLGGINNGSVVYIFGKVALD